MKREKLDKPILAEGEVTGHCHQLRGAVDVFQTQDDTKEFDLDTPTDLDHQEHGTITLTPGQFESDQVLEYDSYKEEARKVVD